MTEQKIYKDDVGVLFKVDSGIDLTSATKLELHVRKPDTTETTWTVTMDPTITTQANYTSIASDLDKVGTYAMYLYVEFTAASKHEGTTVKFRVYDEFQ